ncbi:DUF6890 family protein, partial [Rahnella aceris]
MRRHYLPHENDDPEN